MQTHLGFNYVKTSGAKQGFTLRRLHPLISKRKLNVHHNYNAARKSFQGVPISVSVVEWP